MNVRKVASLIVLLGAWGCADETETRTHELATAGFWAPPAATLALADTYNIQNVQAGPWIGESGCGGSFLEGTRIFRQWLYDNWEQTSTIGGYSCRPIANSSSMSVHATGRALDIMLPRDTSQSYNNSADNDLGDPIANWLLEHAEEVGIQLIIWDNMIWSSGRAPGERLRVYTNDNKHVDHIHMELNPEAAGLGTPWFSGPMDPPDFGPCGDPIPADGGVIDDTDACFQAFGPSEFWRVEGEGYGGSLRWTNAWKADSPSNWARWRVHLAEAGRYRVEYHNVQQWAVYDSAQYRVRHDGTEDDVYIDLSAGADGWQPIGEFDFAAGEDQWVSVYDNAPVEVGEEQHVIADAIRLVLPDVDIEEPPDPNPGMGGPNPQPPDNGGSPGGTTDPDQAPDDGLDDVDAKGGCCATANGQAEPPLALIGVLMFVRLRRRRLTQR